MAHAKKLRGIPPEISQKAVLSVLQVADLLGVSDQTLVRMRKAGDGPRAIKLAPRRIGYRYDDVMTWLESRESA